MDWKTKVVRSGVILLSLGTAGLIIAAESGIPLPPSTTDRAREPPSGSSSQAHGDRTDSVLVFPKVIADGTRDTIIELTNTSKSMVFRELPNGFQAKPRTQMATEPSHRLEAQDMSQPSLTVGPTPTTSPGPDLILMPASKAGIFHHPPGAAGTTEEANVPVPEQ